MGAESMRVLVIGSGGREHALVWKLARSPRVSALWCVPGNGGIREERLVSNGAPAECVDQAGAEDLGGLLAVAQDRQPDLTVVGPDNPLALGVVDQFRAHGFRIWGPSRQGAQFESSKAFSQAFMQRHGIPTAAGEAFDSPQAARAFAAKLNGRCAIKADGLAYGKGVVICRGMAEVDRALEAFLVHGQLGEAGRRVVVQELLSGREVSMHALCDGSRAELFPLARDYKPVGDHDQGPNTGGMGAYSPASAVSEQDQAVIRSQILEPWLKGCREEGIDYHGILYPGLMLTQDGPRVLEFNVRLGDPEAQVYLPRLENDVVELLEASLEGRLDQISLKWSTDTVVCVVMASSGYPGGYEKGKRIQGLEGLRDQSDVKVFHAGTRWDETAGGWVTAGGRVLGVTAWGPDLPRARRRAYEAVDQIHFEGAQFRHDIADQAV